MGKDGTRYYAVVRGRKPGIYDKWYGEDAAQAQVAGFSNALYKGFTSIRDAKEWCKQSSLNKGNVSGGGSMPPAPLEKSNTNREKASYDSNKPDTVMMYTDGGCINNPGPGGYGVVLIYKGNRRELSGGFRRTTNNRMELLACIKGLEALRFKCKVSLCSDSRYVVNGIKKGWAKRWRSKGWKRTETEAAENADLWSQLLDLSEKHGVDFIWIKGHAGHPENEQCDLLAKAAATQKGLPPDLAYEEGKTQWALW